jgi:hypothetical protein
MSEKDALGTFDFNKVTGGGLFIKFQANKPLTLRVLTTDPVVSQQEFENSEGEITLSTKFNFVVYNFTDGHAQILSATPTMARKISEIHADPDFGGNIKSVDIKISPTGEKLQRRYDLQVLPKTTKLTAEMIQEARAINLDEKIEGGTRMSLFNPDNVPQKQVDDEPVPVDETGEEEINFDDIPF